MHSRKPRLNTANMFTPEVQLSLPVCKALGPELISGVLLMLGREDYYVGIFTALKQSVPLVLLPWGFGASIESIPSTGCIYQVKVDRTDLK